MPLSPLCITRQARAERTGILFLLPCAWMVCMYGCISSWHSRKPPDQAPKKNCVNNPLQHQCYGAISHQVAVMPSMATADPQICRINQGHLQQSIHAGTRSPSQSRSPLCVCLTYRCWENTRQLPADGQPSVPLRGNRVLRMHSCHDPSI